MNRREIEKLLRRYGRTLPSEAMFSEAEDRALRARIAEDARREDPARPERPREPRSRRSPAVPLPLFVATGLVAAAAVLLLLLRPGPAPERTPHPWTELVDSGRMHLASGRYPEARSELRSAIDIVDRAPGARAGDRAHVRRLLGDALLALGDLEGSKRSYREAIDLRLPLFPEGYLEVASTLVLLADIEQQEGDLRGAQNLYRQVCDLFQPLSLAEPDQRFFREIVAMSFDRQADLLRRIEEKEEPGEYYTRVTERYENLGEEESVHPLYLRNLAVAYEKQMELALRAGHLEEAREIETKLTAVLEAREERLPDEAPALRDLAASYERIARLAEERLDVESSRGCLDRALALRHRVLETNPDDPADLERLASVHAVLGDIALRSPRRAEAVEHFERYVEIYRSLAERVRDVRIDGNLAIGYAKLADIARAEGDLDREVADHERILELAERMAAAEPANPRFRETLSASQARLGEIARSQGDLEGASRRFRRAVEAYEPLVREEPENRRYLEEISAGYSRLGDVARSRDRSPEALHWYRMALATDERLARLEPENPIYREMLLAGYERVGTLSLAMDRPSDAVEAFEKLLALQRDLSGPTHVLTARALIRLAEAIERGGRIPEGAVALAPDAAAPRADLVEAETLLIEALRIFDRDPETPPDHPWRIETLEALRHLYGPDRLEYPRKRDAIEAKLRSAR
jgi:tetratricopeptide (TPR) repeat protein